MHNFSEYKQAKAFIQKHKIKELSVSSLENALKSMGYSIIYFNPASNSKQVEKLLRLPYVKENLKKSDSYTFSQGSAKFTFICDSLSEQEKIIVLSREIGHIVMKDQEEKSTHAQSIINQHSANEFAHYLIKMTAGDMVSRLLRSPARYITSICASAFLMLFVCIMLAFSVGTAYNSSEINFDMTDYIDISESGFIKEDIEVNNIDPTSSQNLDELFDNQVNTTEIYDKASQVTQVDNNHTNPDSQAQNSQNIIETQNNDPFFYATKSGKKYHKNNCSYVSGKENLIELSNEDIDASKYEPCSKCIK